MTSYWKKRTWLGFLGPTSGDFGLRGFYPADAKGQYDMQLKADDDVVGIRR